MAEGSLASAVALPDANDTPRSPEGGLKRRQSSNADTEPKRRRLSSHQDDQDHRTQPVSSAQSRQRRPSLPGPTPDRDRDGDSRPTRAAASGKEEERRRGKRLFGALLGTLSQSTQTNSAAQKRRADIEKRQQDKLKLQAEEYGELRKKRREETIASRRKEQIFYERESMRVRHANMLAMAHFLKTKTKPVLYYKPWEVRPEDEDVIRDQLKEAKATIDREVADFGAHYPADRTEDVEHQQPREPEAEERPSQVLPNNAETADLREEGDSERDGEKGTQILPSSAAVAATPVDQPNAMGSSQADSQQAADDDGEEVVEEDKEDTVIY